MLKPGLKLNCQKCGEGLVTLQSNPLRQPSICFLCKSKCPICGGVKENMGRVHCSPECRKEGRRPIHNKNKTKKNYKPLQVVSQKMMGNNNCPGYKGKDNPMYGKSTPWLGKFAKENEGKTWEQTFGKEKSEGIKKKCRKKRIFYWSSIENRIKASKTRSDLIVKGLICLTSKHIRGKSGHFYSQKNNKNLHYRCSYELTAYQILEKLSKVIKYEVEPFSIEYKWEDYSSHRYIPDILVYYDDGAKELIEVKPKWKLELEREKLKIEAGRQYAMKNNCKYLVWTEKELYGENSN